MHLFVNFCYSTPCGIAENAVHTHVLHFATALGKVSELRIKQTNKDKYIEYFFKDYVPVELFVMFVVFHFFMNECHI